MKDYVPLAGRPAGKIKNHTKKHYRKRLLKMQAIQEARQRMLRILERND